MRCFLLLLLYHTSISSLDYFVELDGTIGSMRFVMLSQNTVGCEANFNTAGGQEYFLGQVEVNIFNNIAAGKVYLNNFEFKDDKFLAIGNCEQQVALRVYSSLDTSGSPLTPASQVLLRTTSAPAVDSSVIETFTLDFYAIDDTDNTLITQLFIGNFLLYWTDS